jgi:hypothetical protein
VSRETAQTKFYRKNCELRLPADTLAQINFYHKNHERWLAGRMLS